MQNTASQTKHAAPSHTLLAQVSVVDGGFTLVELMATLAIFALLASIAMPSLQSYIRELETKRAVEILQPVFSEARAVSLTERVDVVLCPTQNFTDCNKRNPKGVLSFKDANQNQRHDAGESMLGAVSLKLKHGSIKFNNGTRKDYVRFYSNTGKPRGRPGNVTYCPNDGNAKYAKSLIFNKHGRARLSFDHNGDGKDDKRNRDTPVAANCA